MIAVPELIPISRLRHAQNEILARLSESPVVLTHHGKAAAVLVDPDQWNWLLEELETWQDSFDALEAKYRIETGEEEVINWSKVEAALDGVPA
ncbi:MAG: type II toxin-antitoxin system Phd/YefM family antitoxin [Anaerolineae bacterium]